MHLDTGVLDTGVRRYDGAGLGRAALTRRA